MIQAQRLHHQRPVRGHLLKEAADDDADASVHEEDLCR
jgi:hypothetical protein